MMPHLGEELWRRLGHGQLLVETPWPEADGRLTVDNSVTIAVQVNGKLRATIELPPTPRRRLRNPRPWPRMPCSARSRASRRAR